MKRKIVETTKHQAPAVDAARQNRGIKFIEVTTLFMECGHRRVFRGTSQKIPRIESECRECDRGLVVEHFEDKNFVAQAAKAGVQ